MFNVVLLAAGYATRLYPLTENFPKPLLKVGGKPIANYLLGSLSPLSSEIQEIIVVTNNKYAPHFEDWTRDLKYTAPIRVVNDRTLSNEDRLGAIRDIELALQAFKSPLDTMVLAGDNIFDFDLEILYRKASARDKAVTLACTDVKDLELAKQYGILELDPSGRITKFHEKPKTPPSTMASTGIYFFSRETLPFFERFLSEKHNGDAPGFYISWLVSRAQVFGEPLKGIWYDIGDLASLRKADEFFSNTRSSSKVKRR